MIKMSVCECVERDAFLLAQKRENYGPGTTRGASYFRQSMVVLRSSRTLFYSSGKVRELLANQWIFNSSRSSAVKVRLKRTFSELYKKNRVRELFAEFLANFCILRD
jgi:hypothetical protein